MKCHGEITGAAEGTRFETLMFASVANGAAAAPVGTLLGGVTP